MRLQASLFLALLSVLTLAVGVSGPGATAGSARCGSGTHGSQGYAYAGHQSTSVAHGVRATIAAIGTPAVQEGHVAGWVGVGGPASGPNGEDQWLQAGIASLPRTAPLLYVEITRAGAEPVFRALRFDVEPGERHEIAVLELAGRPGWWRVWVDGVPVTKPISLPGSSKRWKPIATAESWDGGRAVCNGFAFRFEGVSVARAPGGSWQPFVPGYRFRDRGFALRQLRPAGPGERTLARDSLRAFAFEAASA